MRAFVIGAAMALAACGGPHSAGPDAATDAQPDARPPSGPCWPELVQYPRGTAELGTGRDGFEPMPAVLPLEYGGQDGFMFIGNVRMTGFELGNPVDVLDPRNTRTRIRVYFDETGIPLARGSCSFRTAYEPFGDAFQLIEEAPLVFETCWRSEHLIGKRFRIELELLASDGGYASDTRFVIGGEPVGAYPVDMGTPGCPQEPDPDPDPDPEPDPDDAAR